MDAHRHAKDAPSGGGMPAGDWRRSFNRLEREVRSLSRALWQSAGLVPQSPSTAVVAPRPAPSKTPSAEYDRLKERLRRAVRARVPSGSRILVISKGDDSILRHEGRRASHFPQQEDGGYPGHHPADGPSALAHLCRLRDAGHDYLVVPSTYLWWLSHYRELGRYLARSAREVFRSPDTGVIFALPAAAAAAGTATEGAVALGFAGEVGRLGKVLGCLLPPRARVAIAAEAPLPHLSLPDCEVEVFPLRASATGAPSGTAAMPQALEVLRARGVEYLVVPGSGSAIAQVPDELVRHLEATCHCVLRQPRVAHVYRLGPASAVPPPPQP